jgi:hypothetical protein
MKPRAGLRFAGEKFSFIGPFQCLAKLDFTLNKKGIVSNSFCFVKKYYKVKILNFEYAELIIWYTKNLSSRQIMKIHSPDHGLLNIHTLNLCESIRRATT